MDDNGSEFYVEEEEGLFESAGFWIALFLSLMIVAPFLYKVWNERKMTVAYERQAEAQERIADAAERAFPAKFEESFAMKRLVPENLDPSGETAIPEPEGCVAVRCGK